MAEILIIIILSSLLIVCFFWRYKENTELKRQEKEMREEYTRIKLAFNELNQAYAQRQNQIDADINRYREAKRTAYEAECQLIDSTLSIKREQTEHMLQMLEETTQETEAIYNDKIASCKQNYETLLEPLQRMEKEEQEKLFYCLQISPQARQDIDFLLKEVEPHLSNKDLLPKLIWSEYVQKPTAELMNRIEMRDEPGIYKITNLSNGKVYIGQSTKLKSRCQEHIKGALGISSIANQKIHQVMAEEGLWNFTFEKLCECSKEKLNEKEKFYIEFFKANEYGYNQTKGNG